MEQQITKHLKNDDNNEQQIYILSILYLNYIKALSVHNNFNSDFYKFINLERTKLLIELEKFHNINTNTIKPIDNTYFNSISKLVNDNCILHRNNKTGNGDQYSITHDGISRLKVHYNIDEILSQHYNVDFSKLPINYNELTNNIIIDSITYITNSIVGDKNKNNNL